MQCECLPADKISIPEILPLYTRSRDAALLQLTLLIYCLFHQIGNKNNGFQKIPIIFLSALMMLLFGDYLFEYLHLMETRKMRNFFVKSIEVADTIPFGRVTFLWCHAKYLGPARSARMVGWANGTVHIKWGIFQPTEW